VGDGVRTMRSGLSVDIMVVGCTISGHRPDADEQSLHGATRPGGGQATGSSVVTGTRRLNLWS